MLNAVVQERLAALGARYALSPWAIARLGDLLELVAAEPASITTVRDPELGVDVHVADSLVGLALPRLRERRRAIADLGAGGGFPGPRPRRGAARDARVSLVESVGRKCAFLDRAAATLGLDNVDGRQRARGGLGRRPRRARRRDGPRGRAARTSSSSTRRRCSRHGRRARRVEGPPGSDRGGRRQLPPRRSWPGAARGACAVEPFPGAEARHPLCLREGRADAAGVPAARGNGPQTATSEPRLKAERSFGGERPAAPSDRPRRYRRRRRWAPSTRSPTRRAGSARPPPPSTSPRASPRPATRRCSSTSTPRPTRRSASGVPKDAEPNVYDVLAGDATRRRGARRAGDRPASRSCRRIPTSPARPWSCRVSPGSETRLRDALAPRARALRVHAARLPAVARSADRQRARRRRPRDRPGADRVLRARGPRRPARHARRSSSAS